MLWKNLIATPHCALEEPDFPVFLFYFVLFCSSFWPVAAFSLIFSSVHVPDLFVYFIYLFFLIKVSLGCVFPVSVYLFMSVSEITVITEYV